MDLVAWTIEITRPGMVGLVVCLLPVLWYFRRSLVDFARWQQRLSLLVRSLLLASLALAAAGVNLVHRGDRQFVVFLLDRSASVDDAATTQAQQFVAAAAEHLDRRDEARVMDFAADVLPARHIAADAQAPLPEGLDRSHTDIARALSVGWASIPASYAKTLVVLSDGRSTHGEPLAVAQAARMVGVRVCTVPLESDSRDEVQVTQVDAPTQVRTGAPFELVVEVASTHADTGELEVYRNDIQVASEHVEIKPGTNRYRFRQMASADRFQTYAVRLAAARDHLVDNNAASALVACQGKPRVLLVEENPRAARYLTWALEKEDITVEVRGPRGVPRTLADLENYELICLSNVAATDLSGRQMQLIRSYVQDLGGGLIMLGGDKSFGLGGYYKTVLEEILPVRSDFEKEKEKPSLAMVLVIDKSGSMGGQKIELAKEAAKAATELLGSLDQVGVIAFDGSSKWLCPVHPASDKSYILERISSLVAGGGTNLAPALSDAFNALDLARAKLKHVIALTDGHSVPGNFFEVTSAMANADITVSTVAVGVGADRELLERIANWGNGRSYFTEDPGHIPQIFARETMEASKSAINERPFLPQQIRPHQVCQGLNFDEAPFLLGYVIARAKPTAELVLATEAGHPLLATWRYGLGRSLAFTSDAKNRWAAEWLSWDGFSRFWSQVVRDTMRTTSPGLMQVDLDRAGDVMRVSVDALHPSPQRQGEYLDDVKTVLELIRPGRDVEQVLLRQAMPGRYEGRFEVSDLENYHVRISQKRDQVEVQSISHGVAVGYSPEYYVGSSDRTLLRKLADVGGGMYDVGPDAIVDRNARSSRVQPLWPVLVGMALILLIFDVALRRIDWALLTGGARAWRRAVGD